MCGLGGFSYGVDRSYGKLKEVGRGRGLGGFSYGIDRSYGKLKRSRKALDGGVVWVGLVMGCIVAMVS